MAVAPAGETVRVTRCHYCPPVPECTLTCEYVGDRAFSWCPRCPRFWFVRLEHGGIVAWHRQRVRSEAVRGPYLASGRSGDLPAVAATGGQTRAALRWPLTAYQGLAHSRARVRLLWTGAPDVPATEGGQTGGQQT